MKKCSWCGKEFPDDAVVCDVDQTPFESADKTPAAESKRPEFSFAPLSEADKQKDLVTLVTCGTVLGANMIVARLKASGIEAFIPDENLMQAVGFNLNTFGYVRVQISPQDYDAAKDLLTACAEEE